MDGGRIDGQSLQARKLHTGDELCHHYQLQEVLRDRMVVHMVDE